MWAVLLACAIVAFRGRAWFLTFGDAAAGLYLHIAAALLHGHLPYTTAWDYRPPGLFALYALALALFGPQFAWNALTSIALGATAAAVGLLARACDTGHARGTGWLAAASFVFLAPENDGLFGNAEIEMSTCIAWSLWFALRAGTGASLACGVLAGCALQCKLSALPLALLPALALFASAGRSGDRLRRVVVFAGGFALPIALAIAAYATAGALPLLLSANVDATFARAGALNLTYYRANARYLFDQLRILAPHIELAAFARPAAGRAAIVTWCWLGAATVAIVGEGEFFHYQFIVLDAPVALLGTLGLQRLLTTYVLAARARRAIWITAFALTFALHDYYETMQGFGLLYHRTIARDAAWHADDTSEALAALRRVAPAEPSVLLVGQSPYIYDALGIAAPTRFTAPVIWLDPRLTPMGGAAAVGELQRLFDATPRVVVLSRLSDPTYDAGRVQRVRAWIAARYRPIFAGSTFTIYRANRATSS